MKFLPASNKRGKRMKRMFTLLSATVILFAPVVSGAEVKIPDTRYIVSVPSHSA